jgi:hypothetical protein
MNPRKVPGNRDMDRQAAVASVRTWRGSQAEHPRSLTPIVLAAGPTRHKRDSVRKEKCTKIGVVETLRFR